MESIAIQNKSSKALRGIFYCKKCGYQFAKLLNKNTIILFGRKSEQFVINFTKISVICPNSECGAEQTIESILVKDIGQMVKVIEKLNMHRESDRWRLHNIVTLKVAGVRTLKELNQISPYRDINLPPVLKKRFLNSLSKEQKKVYRIMVNDFNGIVWNIKTLKKIKKELNLSEKESELIYVLVLRKIGQIKGYEVESDRLAHVLRNRWWENYEY